LESAVTKRLLCGGVFWFVYYYI